MTQHNVSGMNDSDSDDGDISVGCPSPVAATAASGDDDDNNKYPTGTVDDAPADDSVGRRKSEDEDERRTPGEEYFKPLKKLKMMSLTKKGSAIPLGKQYPIHRGHLPTTSRHESDDEAGPAGHFPPAPPPPPLNFVPPAHLGIPIPIPVALRHHFPGPPGVLLEHRHLLERNLFLESRHLFAAADHRFLLNPTDPRHLLTAADTRHLLTPEQRSLLGLETRLFEKTLIDHRQILEARMLETRLAESNHLAESREDVAGDANLTSSVGQNGVKSFSILDILNHRPRTREETKGESRGSGPGGGGGVGGDAPGKIIRPWDSKAAAAAAAVAEQATGKRSRPKSADFCYSETLSTCSSDRSSTAGSLGGSGSDCCTSPDIINCSASGASSAGSASRQATAARPNGGKASASQGKNTSPLDALFQMTSKTFDGMNGETSGDGQANHLHLFNNRQQPKKKRKSRTAFTNHQIFELEKRFLYQKYLSPADRDEIAGALGLSNAQVITWFQNRRAKLKRDMEELKKDVESAKILTAHKSFLENVQDLGILKKKNVPSHSDDEKSCGVPSLVIPVVTSEK